jgi:hypothetical protein
MITLKTLPQATEQEVFDQAVKHLLTQNAKAIDESGLCNYRAGDLKCAGGCFIAEDEYNEGIDNTIWEELISLGIAPMDHAEIIVTLQIIHDVIDVKKWPQELKRIAIQRNLKYNGK